MAAVRRPVLLGLRDAAVRGRPTGPGAWTASKLGGLPVRWGAGAGVGGRRGEGAGEVPGRTLGLSAPLPSGRPARRGSAEAGVRTLQAAARPGRAGVLPAGRLPVSSAPARVRLSPAAVRQRRRAQVGAEGAELPAGFTRRGGSWRPPGAPAWGWPAGGRSRGSPHRRFSLPRSWRVFRSQCLQVRENEALDAQVKRSWLACYELL